MTSASFRRSASDGWTPPKPQLDPSRRRMIHGRVQSLDEGRGFLERWFGRF